ncbi:MAG: hypothetical protein CSA51_03330 [Gammaproteobacteria bacterium]|nr:MAG: hypothetical protein CSA51_03330 [Gammaproteobacteria bacterium]
MRRALKRLPTGLAFLLTALLAALLVWFGLRVYFDQQRLNTLLTQSVSGEQLHIVAGEASVQQNSLRVENTAAQGLSLVQWENLSVDTRFYARLVVTFAEKHASQPLLMTVKTQHSQATIEHPILYTDNNISRFGLAALVPEKAVITEVGLLTRTLIEPYRISSIRFEPKLFDNMRFAQLLANSFALDSNWRPETRQTRPVIITAKVLVLLYFACVGALFALFLQISQRPVINAWWATLIAAWLLLDAHYLLEKTVKSKNTYETFAPLSDEEKAQLAAPQAQALAKLIASTLPKNQSANTIWVRLPERQNTAGSQTDATQISAKQALTLGDQLRYYLLPNQVTSLSEKLPDALWQQGDFYFVDARPAQQRLNYSSQTQRLSTESGLSVPAVRVLDDARISIYQLQAHQEAGQ